MGASQQFTPGRQNNQNSPFHNGSVQSQNDSYDQNNNKVYMYRKSHDGNPIPEQSEEHKSQSSPMDQRNSTMPDVSEQNMNVNSSTQ